MIPCELLFLCYFYYFFVFFTTFFLFLFKQSTDANVRVWDLSSEEKQTKPAFRDISNSKVRAPPALSLDCAPDVFWSRCRCGAATRQGMLCGSFRLFSGFEAKRLSVHVVVVGILCKYYYFDWFTLLSSIAESDPARDLKPENNANPEGGKVYKHTQKKKL